MRKRFLYTFSAGLATLGIALTGCDWQGGGGDAATTDVSTIDAGERLGAVPSTLYSLIPKKPPMPVPDTVFTDEAGTELTLASFKGEVLLVNMWATWCAPCVQEMPALIKLKDALKGSGAKLIAINQDRSGKDVARPFLNEKGFDLDLYLDPKGDLGRAMKTGGLPSTYVISADGVVIGSVLGMAAWDAPEVVTYFKELAMREKAAQ